MALPRWLAADLGERTGIDYTTRYGKYAKITICRKCGNRTLTGLDGAVAASNATVDPTPINSTQEAACRIAGRMTYTLTDVGRRVEIEARGLGEHIRARPAEHHTVVPAHMCGGGRFPEPPPPTPRARAAQHDEPPF